MALMTEIAFTIRPSVTYVGVAMNAYCFFDFNQEWKLFEIRHSLRSAGGARNGHCHVTAPYHKGFRFLYTPTKRAVLL